MQKPKNLLLIIPLGSPHFKPDLPEVSSPAAKLFRLVFGDVVVQNDHAAVLVLATISLTIPRRGSANAPPTPFALVMPRYLRAMGSRGYSASFNLNASEKKNCVAFKNKRPPQKRGTAA